MSKTLQLISRYYKLLGEQAPEEQIDAGAPGQATPVQPKQPTTLDENEKYVIKILTNSFIFNPTLFDKEKQKYVFNKIDQIKGMVNVPVAKIVNEIKKVIAIDKSLRIESKTLSLLNKFTLLMEQPADATEPQTDTPLVTKGEVPQPVSSNLNKNGGLNLAEIFPLYKELILKALRHAPTDDELMIIKPVVNEFADSDPEKIVETIQNILSQSLEDKEVEDNLSNA